MSRSQIHPAWTPGGSAAATVAAAGAKPALGAGSGIERVHHVARLRLAHGVAVHRDAAIATVEGLRAPPCLAGALVDGIRVPSGAEAALVRERHWPAEDLWTPHERAGSNVESANIGLRPAP